ncbi:MAG: LysM peptidoglycan-binding domain-containing protein [Anaerolineales bacterium]
MNARRLSRALPALVIVVALSFLMGCASPASTVAVSPTATQTVQIKPYKSATPQPTETPMRRPLPTAALQPSPTPFVHEVVQGDTLLAIALRYGVQVEAILAANPGIDPRILSIGTQIVIPLGEDGQAALPTAAPLPVTLGEPTCLPTLTEDLWCYVLAENELDQPVESVMAQITLVNEAGEPVAVLSASPPLNLIPPGGSLPLLAYFTGPLPQDVYPVAQLETAFPGRELEQRYAAVLMDVDEINISADGLSAQISGTLRLPEGRDPAGEMRVAAVAYSDDDRVVGVRVEEDLEPLQADQSRRFTLTVYSMGEKIERVEVFSEARP